MPKRDDFGGPSGIGILPRRIKSLTLPSFHTALAKEPPKPYTLYEQDVGGRFIEVEICRSLSITGQNL